MYQEFNFDGLVGPTHNYAGLAAGNLASAAHKAQTSRPRAAALQGLQKMKALADLGVPQAVLPPLERPSICSLRALGFVGPDDATVLATAHAQAPHLLAACASASSMWTANAATVAPSCDTADGRLHLTPANLSSHLHRSLEAEETTEVLRRVFSDRDRFIVHAPLPGGHPLRDEGAANHTRLSPTFDQAALHLFVYGIDDQHPDRGPQRFPARQTLEASKAIARHHRLAESSAFFLQQNPKVIDVGVFHNDVIAVGHRHLLFHHEEAFAGGESALVELEKAYRERFDQSLVRIVVPTHRVDVQTAVRTYVFNSQIVSVPDGGEHLIAPAECAENKAVATFLDEMVASEANSIQKVHFFDLRESMHNGGGPACLRQRIVLNTEERAALQVRVILDQDLYETLIAWVERHYRETLQPSELADPALLEESRTALDELTGILHLGSVYPFQK